jgi:CelD/BcsL family acetyltransferase involved in cellulose biosynthesis
MAIAWGSDRRVFDLEGAPRARPAGPNRRVSKRPSLAEVRAKAPRLYPAGGCISITTEQELAALEPLWRELHAAASDASPFRSWDFTIEWLRHFVLGRAGDATGRFEIALAFDAQSRLIGGAAMFEERSLGSEALGLILQPFGRSRSFETMTDEPIVLLRRGCEEKAAQALAQHVAGRVAAVGWDLAVVPGGPFLGGPGKRSLAWSRPLESVQVTRPVAGVLPLCLPRRWETFTAGLSKSMRDNIAYYPRRLTRELGEWAIRTAQSPPEIAVAVEQLIDLHNRRSRAATGIAHRSHIANATEASFLRNWLARAAARGEISILSVEVGGEMIAAQAFVEMSGRIAVYYSGFDERYHRYSPLTIITAHLVRSAIARGVRRLEFPPGPTPWKSRWGANDAMVHEEVSIYATRLPALMRGISRRLRLQVRFSMARLAPA